MFKNPFSFEGRIRRTEYGLSSIIYAIAQVILSFILASSSSSSYDSYRTGPSAGASLVVFIFWIPLFIFMLAQGAKRCHDLGNSGWYQLIPLYGFWLLFADSKVGPNQYGDNPKGIGNTHFTFEQAQTPAGTGYQGGYDGGHNNHFPTSPQSTSSSEGYHSGDLYR